MHTKFDIYLVIKKENEKKKDKNKTKQTKGNKTKLLTHSVKGEDKLTQRQNNVFTYTIYTCV